MNKKPLGEYTISTYHEYLEEGIISLHSALTNINKAKKRSKNSSKYLTKANINSRYAFLMFANSLEAAANAFLLNLELSEESYKELEKLSTLSKIHLYCDIKNIEVDKGNTMNSQIKEIINCRNEFVHPKPKNIEVDISNKNPVFLTKKTKSKGYPLYFSEIKFEHALEAVKDILKFLAWICFDVCKFILEDGVYIIGYNISKDSKIISDFSKAAKTHLDLRTFGKL